MAEDSSEVVREMAEAAAASNVKVVSEGPAFFTNMQYAEANANTAAMNQLRIAILGKVTEAIIGVSPSEGGADVAALQQLMKGAALTPPVTAKPIAET